MHIIHLCVYTFTVSCERQKKLKKKILYELARAHNMIMNRHGIMRRDKISCMSHNSTCYGSIFFFPSLIFGAQWMRRCQVINIQGKGNGCSNPHWESWARVVWRGSSFASSYARTRRVWAGRKREEEATSGGRVRVWREFGKGDEFVVLIHSVICDFYFLGDLAGKFCLNLYCYCDFFFLLVIVRKVIFSFLLIRK